MRVKLTGTNGETGELRALCGVCMQDPSLVDPQGQRFFEALPDRWRDLPKSLIRHPNGSAIYAIDSAQDAKFLLARDTILAEQPGSVGWQIDFPPQLPASTLTSWANDRLERISFGNEPPNHITSVWADGDEYADDFRAFYDACPEAYKDLVWFQSGKPEVIRYGADVGLGAQAVAKHQSVIDAMEAVVAEGYPARVMTTHKMDDRYPTDKLAFYREIMGDYRASYGTGVKVVFTELKWKAAVVVDLDSLLAMAEVMLILARLKQEYPSNLVGAAYQQGSGVGTINLIGRDESNVWTWTAQGALWNLFAGKLMRCTYLGSESTDRPDGVQVEIVRSCGRTYAMYSNTTQDAVSINGRGSQIIYFDSDLTKKVGTFTGSLPARSCGVVQLFGKRFT
jgi:hypothetical protein